MATAKDGIGADIDLDDVGRDAPEVRLSEEDIVIC